MYRCSSGFKVTPKGACNALDLVPFLAMYASDTLLRFDVFYICKKCQGKAPTHALTCETSCYDFLLATPVNAACLKTSTK